MRKISHAKIIDTSEAIHYRGCEQDTASENQLFRMTERDPLGIALDLLSDTQRRNGEHGNSAFIQDMGDSLG